MRNIRHLKTGQALVEFALAATLIFFLLAAAVDLDTAHPWHTTRSVLTRLGDAQFNAEARVDVAEVSAEAQELIRSWI